MIKTKRTAELTIPCHWNRVIIDKILIQNESASRKVTEVYGALAEGGPVGHGRSPDTVVKVTMQEAISFRYYLRSKGLRFTYLLNAPFRFTGETKQKKALEDYLGWILSELRPDALTISSYELMKFVRSVDSEVPIHISTIAGIKTVQDLQTYMNIRPSRIIPHHDVGKNWHDLKDLYRFGEQNGVQIELLVTESCLYKCPSRTAHYEYLTYGRKDEPFHLICNAKKMINPSEFLLAGGIVRPEDLSIFEEMGVSYFKVTGRSKSADWLPETTNAYQQGRYNGNLIRLLEVDPSLKMEEWFYIDNKGMEGFMKSFPSNKDDIIRRKYCNVWAVKLFQEGRMYTKDGSQYSIKKGRIELLGEGGSRVAPIIKQEKRV